MADLPYYFQEESGAKKYLEGLVPLIILVLIAVVLVGKTTNIFCDVPGLDAAFCGGGNIINIAVIGSLEATTSDGKTLVNAPELRSLLDGELGRACNMQYQVFNPDDLTYVQASLLKNYDLLILAGDRDYTRPVRTAVETYLNSGGKVVIIGDAATKDPEDALYNGWGHIEVPIELRNRQDGLTDNNVPYLILSDPVVKVVDLDHPINVGYGLKLDLSQILDKPTCSGTLTTIDVNPLTGGTISILTGTDSVNSDTTTVPAVVEEKGILGGSIYYFSFDPGCMPNMWISTVQEITGKQTCQLG